MPSGNWKRRTVVSVGLGLLLSLLLAYLWYTLLAQQYVGLLDPVMNAILARLSLGKWRVDLVLLHLANWIPFVTLAVVHIVSHRNRRRVIFSMFAGLMLIVLGHVLLSIYMMYLHVRFLDSPLYPYGLIVGFCLHDLMPLALWLRIAPPDWARQQANVRIKKEIRSISI